MAKRKGTKGQITI